MTSALKKKIIDGIIAVEGDYVNDPNDSGGETKFGITKAVAIANGYEDDMRQLPRELAFEIYSKKYWDSLRLDEIVEIAPTVAEELADTGVNMGVDRAGKFLQRCLNTLNNSGQDLIVDGKPGDKTITALKGFLHIRGLEGECVLFNMLNCLQGEFYISLVEKNPKNKNFIYGWFKNRVRIK